VFKYSKATKGVDDVTQVVSLSLAEAYRVSGDCYMDLCEQTQDVAHAKKAKENFMAAAEQLSDLQRMFDSGF
jgi:hypothetical protein